MSKQVVSLAALLALAVIGGVLAWVSSETPETEEVVSLSPSDLPPAVPGPHIAPSRYVNVDRVPPREFDAVVDQVEAAAARDGGEVLRCRVPLPPGHALAATPDDPVAHWRGLHVFRVPSDAATRDVVDGDGARVGVVRWQATDAGWACAWMRD